MTLVDRIARAMEAEALTATPIDTIEETHALSIRMARAALKAMREPTFAMVKAVAVASKPAPISPAFADLIWTTMIDRALTESQEQT